MPLRTSQGVARNGMLAVEIIYEVPLFIDLHGRTEVDIGLSRRQSRQEKSMVTSNINGIHELLNPGTVSVQMEGASKSEILDRMLNLLADHPNIRDFEGVRRAVREREEVMSTGVGKGLALPHAKTSAVDGIAAAFATTEVPIEYGSIDNQPVRLLFLMVSTENAKTQHIKILSRISRLMNEDDFRERLLAATRSEDIIKYFYEGELGLP